MQKMQEHFSALHCPTTRHPWRSSCRQAPMDGFTAFLDRHTPHPKIGETAQTGNCWGSVARLTGVGGRDSQRQAYMEVSRRPLTDTPAPKFDQQRVYKGVRKTGNKFLEVISCLFLSSPGFLWIC